MWDLIRFFENLVTSRNEATSRGHDLHFLASYDALIIITNRCCFIKVEEFLDDPGDARDGADGASAGGPCFISIDFWINIALTEQLTFLF